MANDTLDKEIEDALNQLGKEVQDLNTAHLARAAVSELERLEQAIAVTLKKVGRLLHPDARQ